MLGCSSEGECVRMCMCKREREGKGMKFDLKVLINYLIVVVVVRFLLL